MECECAKYDEHKVIEMEPTVSVYQHMLVASTEIWTFVDLSVDDARDLASLMFEAGAGHLVTSEAGVGRRIYFFSPTAKRVFHKYATSKTVSEQVSSGDADIRRQEPELTPGLRPGDLSAGQAVRSDSVGGGAQLVLLALCQPHYLSYIVTDLLTDSAKAFCGCGAQGEGDNRYGALAALSVAPGRWTNVVRAELPDRR